MSAPSDRRSIAPSEKDPSCPLNLYRNVGPLSLGRLDKEGSQTLREIKSMPISGAALEFWKRSQQSDVKGQSVKREGCGNSCDRQNNGSSQ